MSIITLILLVLAFVLFGLSAAGVPNPPRFQFLSAGLMCWVLSVLLTGVKM
jgi:hypothetical protein